jgi:hypothetical protein
MPDLDWPDDFEDDDMPSWDDYEPEPVVYPEDGFIGEPVKGDTWTDAIGNVWEYVVDPQGEWPFNYHWIRRPRNGPVR